MLCVTDKPEEGNAFGKATLADWQQVHGRLPPLLVRYLLSGERSACVVGSLSASGCRTAVRSQDCTAYAQCLSVLRLYCIGACPPDQLCVLPIHLHPHPAADQGDWFTRLVAYLLWVKKNAQGPWPMYINMLPKVRSSSSGEGARRAGSALATHPAAARGHRHACCVDHMLSRRLEQLSALAGCCTHPGCIPPPCCLTAHRCCLAVAFVALLLRYATARLHACRWMS